MKTASVGGNRRLPTDRKGSKWASADLLIRAAIGDPNVMIYILQITDSSDLGDCKNIPHQIQRCTR